LAGVFGDIWLKMPVDERVFQNYRWVFGVEINYVHPVNFSAITFWRGWRAQMIDGL